MSDRSSTFQGTNNILILPIYTATGNDFDDFNDSSSGIFVGDTRVPNYSPAPGRSDSSSLDSGNNTLMNHNHTSIASEHSFSVLAKRGAMPPPHFPRTPLPPTSLPTTGSPSLPTRPSQSLRPSSLSLQQSLTNQSPLKKQI